MYHGGGAVSFSRDLSSVPLKWFVSSRRGQDLTTLCIITSSLPTSLRPCYYVPTITTFRQCSLIGWLRLCSGFGNPPVGRFRILPTSFILRHPPSPYFTPRDTPSSITLALMPVNILWLIAFEDLRVGCVGFVCFYNLLPRNI